MFSFRFVPGYEIIIEAFRSYPFRSLFIVGCILVAGLAEGLGVAVFLPVLSLAIDDLTTSKSEISTLISEFLNNIGISTDLNVLLILMVVGFSLKGVLMMLAMQQIGFASARISTDLRFDLIKSILGARWSYYTKQPIGILTNAMTTEANRGGAAFTGAYTIVAVTIQVAVYVMLAILVSWKLAISSLIVGILIMLVLGRFISMSRRASQVNSDSFDRMQRQLTDMLGGIKPLKAMGMQNLVGPLLKAEAELINKSVRNLVTAKHGLQWLREPILTIFIALGLYGALAIWNLSFEVVVIMTLLFYRTTTSVARVQISYQQLVSSDVYYRRIKKKIEIAQENQENIVGKIHSRFSNSIKLENIFITLGNHPVLSNLSMHIPAKKFTTLFGPSGSGKTTLADILIGLYKPDEGKILIDDISLDQINLDSWRKVIGYVPQDIFLFNDTLLNNVTLGDPQYTETNAKEALKAAGAWSFVSTQSNGINSLVGERGLMISGGQRQRIAIARALVRNPQFLILDEPTTALDPETESEICLTLKNLSNKTTILAISHQPALLEIADNSYKIENGKATLVNG